jgi:hypothetical protein
MEWGCLRWDEMFCSRDEDISLEDFRSGVRDIYSGCDVYLRGDKSTYRVCKEKIGNVRVNLGNLGCSVENRI